MLDLEPLLPRVATILDVGANEGQMALPFARAFPEARVFAFEPVPSTFSVLRARTSGVPLIRCFDVALGAYDGEATIRLAERSGHNSLLNVVAEPGPDTVTFPVIRGDAWASANEVEHVDVLKLDTEGYDLEVLDGFESSSRPARFSRFSSSASSTKFARATHKLLQAVRASDRARHGIHDALHGFHLVEPVRLGQRAVHPVLSRAKVRLPSYVRIEARELGADGCH